MVSMSCSEHDGFTANSQFITHLMGRILGAQGLKATPVRDLLCVLLVSCYYSVLISHYGVAVLTSHKD
jgi:prephenate dehydrogenase